TKGGLVVREIGIDHSLGEVYTLQRPMIGTHRAPMFDSASDTGFIEACRQLLADKLFLEQQDYGNLLGDRKMKWHYPQNWSDGIMPGNGRWIFGKAQSFLRRPDGTIVSFSKMGWV